MRKSNFFSLRFNFYLCSRGIEKSVVSEEKENIPFDIFPLWHLPSSFECESLIFLTIFFTYMVEESKNRLYPKKTKIFHSDRVSSCESLIFSYHVTLRFNFYLCDRGNRGTLRSGRIGWKSVPRYCKKKVFFPIFFHSDRIEFRVRYNESLVFLTTF